jgi:hypothetical protein
MLKYLKVMSVVIFLAWPMTGVIGRERAPVVYGLLAYMQALALPFIVNSYVTGRIELEGRISI